MSAGYDSKRIYQVRCKSGLMGWRTRLQNNYKDYAEWQDYACAHNLAARLGYVHTRAAWDANPIVEGSVQPSDFQIHTPKQR